MKYTEYIRIEMSDYQIYQERHSDEWSEVAFIDCFKKENDL